MNYRTLLPILAVLASCFTTKAQQGNAKCFEDCFARSLAFQKSHMAANSRNSADPNVLDQLKGCSFPEKPLKDLNGGQSTMAQYKGKLVFIHFWFKGCAPCIAEIPSINRLEKEFKNKEIAFVAISCDKTKEVTEFLERKPLNVIHYTIPKEVDIDDYCAVGGYPMNMLLDKNGKVAEVWSGGSPDESRQQEFYNKVKDLIIKNL